MTTTSTDELDLEINQLAYAIRNNRHWSPAKIDKNRKKLYHLVQLRAERRVREAAR